MIVRAIVFDCFGVLYASSIDALVRLCAPEDKLLLRDINKQHDYGFISGQEYESKIAEIFGWTRQQAHNFLMQKRVRNSALIDYIADLRQQHRGLKIALLSNVGSDTLEYLFAPDELDKLFDVRILSYEESLAKPNPEIFVLTAERLGVATGECVMIDDRAENCEGAEIAGMKALQYTDNNLIIQRLNALLEA